MAENIEQFQFTVEGKRFSLPEEKVPAKSILELAQDKGIKAAQDGIEKLTLKGKETIYRGDDLVDLTQEDDFTIGAVVYKFMVNGQEMESNMEKLVSLDIIKMAQEKGVPLPGKPENLLLQVVGQEHEFKYDAWVDLTQFNEFLLLLNESAPVAS